MSGENYDRYVLSRDSKEVRELKDENIQLKARILKLESLLKVEDPSQSVLLLKDTEHWIFPRGELENMLVSKQCTQNSYFQVWTNQLDVIFKTTVEVQVKDLDV